MRNTLEKDHTEDADAAFIDIYRKLRPGEPPTPDSARALLENLFFNPKRYDMAKVGRHKVSKKLRDEYAKLPLKQATTSRSRTPTPRPARSTTSCRRPTSSPRCRTS